MINHTAAAVSAILAAALLLLFAATPSTVQPYVLPVGTRGVDAGCLVKAANMSDCMTYMEEGSNLTVPARPSCSELLGLAQSDITCLCELFAWPDSLDATSAGFLEPPESDDGPEMVSQIAPGTSWSSPEPKKNGGNGARRTGTALSSFAIVAAAIPTFSLAS